MKRIATVGEVLQRLTPPDHNKLEQATSLNVAYGGSEANIAIGLANFGHDVRLATVLPNNPLGTAALRSIRQYGIDTAPTLLSGDILGTYYLEVGHSIRSSSVVYNRKYSAIAQADETALNMDDILHNRTHLHLSGITLALGEGIRNFAIQLAKAAHERGIIISFDFNYRAKLWTVEEAKPAFKAILPYIHIAFASMWDIETFAEIEATNQASLENKRQSVFGQFLNVSNCQAVFGTIRHAKSTHENTLQAYCYTDSDCYLSKTYDFEIIDRVGGGDAFVTGILNKLDLEAQNFEEALAYGIACGALKHTINGDVLLTTDDEIQAIASSDQLGGIKR